MKFFTAAVFSLFAAVASQGAKPPPQQVTVNSINYGGSGCPQGSVGTSFSNDRTSFTLIFDQFVASTGPGVAIGEGRKNCQINVNLNIPGGWSFSIATVDYRGYVQLPAGMTAEQKSIYYFQGEVAQASSGSKFVGPISKDYLSRDTIPLTAVVWMPCGRVVPVNINAQVRLMGRGQGQITTDSIDGKVRQILGLQWKRC
jgi:hypothetical protein